MNQVITQRAAECFEPLDELLVIRLLRARVIAIIIIVRCFVAFVDRYPGAILVEGTLAGKGS